MVRLGQTRARLEKVFVPCRFQQWRKDFLGLRGALFVEIGRREFGCDLRILPGQRMGFFQFDHGFHCMPIFPQQAAHRV